MHVVGSVDHGSGRARQDRCGKCWVARAMKLYI